MLQKLIDERFNIGRYNSKIREFNMGERIFSGSIDHDLIDIFLKGRIAK